MTSAERGAAVPVFNVEGLELPWKVGEGSYNDGLRIESTIARVHPQSRSIGLGNTMTVCSRIAYVTETTAGQGAKTAAFIVHACNSHAALSQRNEELVAVLRRALMSVQRAAENKPASEWEHIYKQMCAALSKATPGSGV